MASASSFRLTVDQGPTPGEAHELTQGIILIGRDPDKNAIVINTAGVSREHARLAREGEAYTLEDLGSANGTFVNDRQLKPHDPRRLNSGDRVKLGQTVTLTYAAPAAAIGPTATVAEPPPLAAGTAPRTPPAARPAPPPPPPRPAAQPPMPPSAQAAPYAPVGPAGLAGATVFVPPSAEKAEPPQLIVEAAGEGKMTFTLTEPAYTLGRGEDNTIQVASRIVSRHHARLERVNGGYRVFAVPEAGNPLNFQGRPLAEPRVLRHNDLLRIGGQDPGTMVTLTYVSPSMAQALAPVSVVFGERTEIQIGRDAGNDVRLDVPAVSRFHAVIQRVGQRYRVRDLRSVNGTFVNDARVEGDLWLNPNDAIRIGPYRFVLGQDQLVQHDESGGVRMDVLGLNKWVRKDLNILQNIYLAIQPREFVVLVGLSGAGKSTMMDAIAGYRPATHGQVLVNNTDVYQHFDAVRNEIGFVPQKDIIHMELSVYQALDYAAQLRMPADTSRQERHKRIMEVLADLDLTERKDLPVVRLSGGQQKRVSIGVELLTKPGLFFLDEPTSGLDPGTETALMQLMRRLADQGRTIILITHATKNVMLADKVIFLVRGGYLAWFGPPNEALQYFDGYRSERGRRAKDIEFDDIYNLLQDAKIGSPKEWSERFQKQPAYQQYIVQPLQHHVQAGAAAPGGAVRTTPARAVSRPRRQVSSLRQFIILSLRNVNILFRDRFSLLLMLLTAPLVGVLTTVVAKREAFHIKNGDFPEAITGVFLLLIFAIIVAIMAQMREIVKEQDIYRRERLVNLKIVPYVLSKVWLAGLLALYHSAVYLVIRYAMVDMPGGYWEFFLLFVTLALTTFAGMMLGLFASALAPNANAAPLIATLFIVPQILLGGALLPLPSLGPVGGVLSSVVPSRWGFEAAMTITGIGKDIASDTCWTLPKVQREALTDAEKESNCHCMGVNMFRTSQFGSPCYFPGLAKFYNEAIDQPEPERPAEPAAPGPPPQFPQIADPPELPTTNDPAAQQRFAKEYNEWRQTSGQAQASFKSDMTNYQAQLDDFKAKSNRYQDEISEYQRKVVEWKGGRTGAIASGENLLGRLDEQFGQTYDVNIPSRWFFLIMITLVLFVGILILQKRKDVI
ncbi:MAG: FHA domain-containing protein [Chloroflexi bacterium]|nr:FHA domain-containing protein [Chloroflexota bacterium]